MSVGMDSFPYKVAVKCLVNRPWNKKGNETKRSKPGAKLCLYLISIVLHGLTTLRLTFYFYPSPSSSNIPILPFIFVLAVVITAAISDSIQSSSIYHRLICSGVWPIILYVIYSMGLSPSISFRLPSSSFLPSRVIVFIVILFCLVMVLCI